VARDQAYLGNRTSTVLGRRLGGELLDMREACGLTQGQAAKVLSASTAKVAKMERGWVPMRDPDIRALCSEYGVDDQATIGRLLELARTDRERRKAKGWWNKYPELRDMAEYVAMEDVATSIRTWQMCFIPGLFQTAGYTRALAVGSSDWDDPDEIERWVETKLARQARLTGTAPLHIWAVVYEAALRQLVGGPEVMSSQLEHLLDIARLPNVRLQVLPFRAGAHPCMNNPFNIISFAESGAMDVVYLDHSAGTVWLESESSAAQHSEYFDRTARLSLTQHDSQVLIDSIAKGM
jgi:hypothetical protein